MAHAIWKGTISFGLVTIPVGLFSAVAQRDVSFHLLDGRDFAAVKNRRVNESTGEEVPWESVVKGYKLPDGRWVTMTDEDFSAANVRATRTIDVLGRGLCRGGPGHLLGHAVLPRARASGRQGVRAAARGPASSRPRGDRPDRDPLAPAPLRARARRRRAAARGVALPVRAACRRGPRPTRSRPRGARRHRGGARFGRPAGRHHRGHLGSRRATTTPTATTCWRSSTARPRARRSQWPRSLKRPRHRWSTSSSCSRRASRTPAPRARRARRHRADDTARGVPRQARLHADPRAGRRGRARCNRGRLGGHRAAALRHPEARRDGTPL